MKCSIFASHTNVRSEQNSITFVAQRYQCETQQKHTHTNRSNPLILHERHLSLNFFYRFARFVRININFCFVWHWYIIRVGNLFERTCTDSGRSFRDWHEHWAFCVYVYSLRVHRSQGEIEYIWALLTSFWWNIHTRAVGSRRRGWMEYCPSCTCGTLLRLLFNRQHHAENKKNFGSFYRIHYSSISIIYNNNHKAITNNSHGAGCDMHCPPLQQH